MKLRIIFPLFVLLLPLIQGCMPRSDIEVSSPLAAPTRITSLRGASIIAPTGWMTLTGASGKNTCMAVSIERNQWQSSVMIVPLQTPEYLPPQEEVRKMSEAQRAALLAKYDQEQERLRSPDTTLIISNKTELREINGLYGIVSNNVSKGPKDRAPVRQMRLTVRVGEATTVISVHCFDAQDPGQERVAEGIINSFEFKAPEQQP